MDRKRWLTAGIATAGFLVIGAIALASFVGFPSHTYEPNISDAETVQDTSSPSEKLKKLASSLVSSRGDHVSTPEVVKAVYMSQCAASAASFREHFLYLIESTELNSIVIDVKDYTGTVAFARADPTEESENGGEGCRVSDMKEFLTELHQKGIYTIARITVFQDPYRANLKPEWAVKKASDGSVWRDRKGLAFIDVSAREYWDWIVELSRESYDLGFDEINFDYIRFPSDGNMQDIAFPHTGNMSKEDALERFFAYLHQELSGTSIVTSADIFGMTTTAEDGMGIGQVLERTLPYFDYVAPMVYPSHYPTGFNGWSNPNTVPYELIHYVMGSAVARTIATSTKVVLSNVERQPVYGIVQADVNATTTPPRPIVGYVYPKQAWSREKLRPWIQDFDYGGNYGPAEVRAQIQAVYDTGLDSWMLWDPSNEYTREALKTEDVAPARP